MVCAELFVGPAVRALRGMLETGWRMFRAALQADVALTGDRRTFFPAHWTAADGGPVVRTLPWEGSSDLRGTAIANGLIDFRQGGRTYAAGEIVDVVEL
jgi:molybdopterin biosynthesis enzyme